MYFQRVFRNPVAGKAAAVFVACALLGACASAPRVRSDAAQMVIAPVPPEHDLLAKLLAAQFALQDGDTAGAARGFTDAAALSGDPRVAEEAVHLAIDVKDWPLAERALARWQQLAPEHGSMLQMRAWIALGQQRGDAAYADLETIAARGGDDAWRMIAQALFGAPDKALAARLLARLATPASLGEQQTDWIAISQLALALGDKAQAQRLADAAVARFHSSEAYIWSARLAIDRGDRPAARAIYAEALQRDPDNLRLRGGYAVLLADGGDNAGAARVLATGPQDDVTYGARAAYLARADDKAALGSLYRQMQADKSPRSGRRVYLLGQIAEILDMRAEALAWYRAVGDDDEHWFDTQIRQAVVLNDMGRTDQALDFLRQLEDQSGARNDTQGRAWAPCSIRSKNCVGGETNTLSAIWMLEADILTHRNRLREALAIYMRALERRPDDPHFLYMRGLLLVESGDAAAGERDLRRVIELNPNDADALNALGYTLADGSRMGDPRQHEALDLIRRALELKPDEAAIIDSMGWVHYRMGDLDAALRELRRAYAKQPDADIAAHLGEVLWMKGERDEARKVWDEGRKKDAKNKTLLEAIQRLTAS